MLIGVLSTETGVPASTIRYCRKPASCPDHKGSAGNDGTAPKQKSICSSSSSRRHAGFIWTRCACSCKGSARTPSHPNDGASSQNRRNTRSMSKWKNCASCADSSSRSPTASASTLRSAHGRPAHRHHVSSSPSRPKSRPSWRECFDDPAFRDPTAAFAAPAQYPEFCCELLEVLEFLLDGCEVGVRDAVDLRHMASSSPRTTATGRVLRRA